MGQSKGNGYTTMPTLTPEQQAGQSDILKMLAPYLQQSAQGFGQFLPGGGGGEAISNAAHQRFFQQTVPGIQNAFGSNAKSSSALNQALAAGAANLNTDIASQLAQMQLGAAQGIGGLAQGAQQQLNNPSFAYLPRQQPFWQQLLLAGSQNAGKLAGAALGAV